MEILFDHNLTRKLRSHFSQHRVRLTSEEEWQKLSNGKLLAEAQDCFDVMVTTDSNLYHQNKVSKYNIAVIVLRAYSNSYDSLVGMMPDVMKALDGIQPGEVRYVYVDDKLAESDKRKGKGL